MESVQVRKKASAQYSKDEDRRNESLDSRSESISELASGFRSFANTVDWQVQDYHLLIDHTKDGFVIDFRFKADVKFPKSDHPRTGPL